MDKLLELLEKLVRAIFGPGDEQDAEEAKPAPEPPEPPGAEAVTGWQGGPPYRYIDVSRYQGKITLDGWRQSGGLQGSNAQDGEHQPQALQAGRRPVYRPHL